MGCCCSRVGSASTSIGGAQAAGAAPVADAPPPSPIAPIQEQKRSDGSAQPAAGANLVSGATQHSKTENARVVADVAKQLGVDPVLAVADMLTESGGNNMEHTGDGGSSFGLFQLHEHGELPKDWYRGAANHDKAFDPRANAEIALKEFAANKDRYSGASLAYHAQRPADEAGYERSVNSHMAEARQLLGM